jgi:RND family efflux transporter MFP subunit
MPRLMIRFACLAAFLLALAGCKEPSEYQPPPPPDVTVSRPLVRTVMNYLEETGTTEAVGRVDVRARVTGFLEEMRFEPGQTVAEGDVLYVIEQRPFQAAVDSAKAQLDASQAQLSQAEIDYQREQELMARNATSQQELLTAKTKRDAAQAAVEAATASLDRASLDLEYTDVKAPIGGRVGKTLLKVGNLVDGNAATELTTIIQYDPIWANFNISERDLLVLREMRNQSGEQDEEKDISDVDAFLQRAGDKGFPFQGKLDYADLAVDQSTGTFLIRARFDNPNLDIVPGLFVEIRIPIGQQPDALLVPEAALGADQAGKYLFVVGGDNRAERRNVSVGAKHGEMVVIEEGLKPEDRVIVRGNQRARDGAPVAPTEMTLTFDEAEARPSGEPIEPPAEAMPPADVVEQPQP